LSDESYHRREWLATDFEAINRTIFSFDVRSKGTNGFPRE